MLGLSLLQEKGFEEELNKSAIRGMLKYIDDQLGYGVSQLMTEEEKDRVLEYKKGFGKDTVYEFSSSKEKVFWLSTSFKMVRRIKPVFAREI